MTRGVIWIYVLYSFLAVCGLRWNMKKARIEIESRRVNTWGKHEIEFSTCKGFNLSFTAGWNYSEAFANDGRKWWDSLWWRHICLIVSETTPPSPQERSLISLKDFQQNWRTPPPPPNIFPLFPHNKQISSRLCIQFIVCFCSVWEECKINKVKSQKPTINQNSSTWISIFPATFLLFIFCIRILHSLKFFYLNDSILFLQPFKGFSVEIVLFFWTLHLWDYWLYFAIWYLAIKNSIILWTDGSEKKKTLESRTWT